MSWTDIRRVVRVATLATSSGRVMRLALLGVFSGVLDILGIFSVVPLVYIVLEPAALDRHPFLASLARATGASSHARFVFVCMSALLFVIVVKNGLAAYVTHAQLRLSFDVAVRVAVHTLRGYFARGFQFVADADHAMLWRRVMVVPYGLSGILQSGFFLLTEVAVIGLTLIGLALFNGGALALTLVVITPLSILFYRAVREKAQELGATHARLYPATNKRLLDTLAGFAEIELLGKEEFFVRRFLRSRQLLDHNESLSQLLGLIPTRVIEILTFLGVVLVIAFHLLRGDRPPLIMASLTVFSAAAYRLMPSVNRVLASLIRIRNGAYALEGLEELAKGMAEEGPRDAVSALGFKSRIRFVDVSYQYPRAAGTGLRGLNLEVPRGACIGFVGRSGAGKTTLLKLVLRFLTEDEGQVLVDEERLASENMRSWRQLLGYVPQEVFILDDTLRANVALGEESEAVSDERVQRALQDARLAPLLARLPEGLETRLGERGARLSGGEKQRIGIARAFYSGAEVFVFDEMTSALDHETEQEIVESIRQLKALGKTILIIAHRTTTLRACDRIYRLEDGQVRGVHSYGDLITVPRQGD